MGLERVSVGLGLGFGSGLGSVARRRGSGCGLWREEGVAPPGRATIGPQPVAATGERGDGRLAVDLKVGRLT